MTAQGKKSPPSKKPLQLSETALREMIRPHVPKAIETLVELLTNGQNDSVKLGAAKVLLAKVMPDLKSTDVHGDIKGKWIVELKKYGHNTSNQVGDQPTT